MKVIGDSNLMDYAKYLIEERTHQQTRRLGALDDTLVDRQIERSFSRIFRITITVSIS